MSGTEAIIPPVTQVNNVATIGIVDLPPGPKPGRLLASP